MEEKRIAYRGEKFTLEWFFNDQEKSEILEYFTKLSYDRKKKILHLFYVLGDEGKLFNEEKFRYEGDQIYALKTSDDRFLCFFFDGAKIIITNAYVKKTKKIPPREKQRALKAKAEYIKRRKDGSDNG
ncbi:MAG: type II toxin-antitoxin system RelE/ParE family toxin [bacterium]